ncbi:MAG TPA: phosphonate ABC transporter ATP-binding protein [Clostridia bacterium]
MSQLIVESLKKSYTASAKALEDISFEIKQGEFVAIIGPSGSGKSTVLRCINKMIEPSGGRIIFNGKEISSIGGKKIRDVRRQIGMVFQHYNLVNRLTVLQNVLHGRLGYMSTIKGVFSLYSEEDKQKAITLLERVGMSEYIYRRAGELSGGQKQRVGIVRALMQEPSLLLCDEPIASLDPNSAKVIMDLIWTLTKENGISCIVNLHQVHVAKEYATRVIGVRSGKIVFDGPPFMLTSTIIEKIYDTPIEKLMINEEVEAVV